MRVITCNILTTGVRVFGMLQLMALLVVVLQVMALVVGMFLICWMPWTVHVLFIYYGSNQLPSEGRTLLTLLAFFNSLANPFIYIWSIREFRYTFKRIFLRYNQSIRVSPINIVSCSTVYNTSVSEKM